MENEQRPAQVTARPRSVEDLTDYLGHAFDGGAYLRPSASDGDPLGDVDGVRRMPLSVTARLDVSVTVPDGVDEADVVRSLRVHVESPRYPVAVLSAEVLDAEA